MYFQFTSCVYGVAHSGFCLCFFCLCFWKYSKEIREGRKWWSEPQTDVTVRGLRNVFRSITKIREKRNYSKMFPFEILYENIHKRTWNWHNSTFSRLTKLRKYKTMHWKNVLKKPNKAAYFWGIDSYWVPRFATIRFYR